METKEAEASTSTASSEKNEDVTMETGEATEAPSVSKATNKQQEKKGRLVYARGFPKTAKTEAVATCFGAFGDIKSIKLFQKEIRESYALVEFHTAAEAEECVKKTVMFDGIQIFLDMFRPSGKKGPRGRRFGPAQKKFQANKGKKKLTPKQRQEEREKGKERRAQQAAVRKESFLKQFTFLGSATSMEDQMEKLMEFTQMDPKVVEQLKNLGLRLQEFLRNYFPECLVTVIGSVSNGLAVKHARYNSGLDLEVDLHLEEQIKTESQPTRAIPEMKFQAPLPTDPAELQKVSPALLCQWLAWLLRQPSVRNRGVVTVGGPRQLVKFVQIIPHQCNLTVHDGLMVQSSKLLQCIQEYDARVRPLLFAVRFWAQQCRLSMWNELHLSHYALALMVVCYLQCTQPPVLPSVQYLMQLAGDNQKLVNGWESLFCEDITKWPQTENEETPAQLLVGFFYFYQQMAFSRVAICPHVGTVAPLSYFLSNMMLPEHVNQFKTAPINIQDPFALDTNIAHGVDEHYYEKWVRALCMSKEICELPEFGQPSESEPWGLMHWLDTDATSKEPDEASSEQEADKEQKEKEDKARAEQQLSIPCMKNNFINRKVWTDCTLNSQTIWASQVCKIVHLFLTKVLRCQVRVAHSAVPDLEALTCDLEVMRHVLGEGGDTLMKAEPGIAQNGHAVQEGVTQMGAGGDAGVTATTASAGLVDGEDVLDAGNYKRMLLLQAQCVYSQDVINNRKATREVIVKSPQDCGIRYEGGLSQYMVDIKQAPRVEPAVFDVEVSVETKISVVGFFNVSTRVILDFNVLRNETQFANVRRFIVSRLPKCVFKDINKPFLSKSEQS